MRKATASLTLVLLIISSNAFSASDNCTAKIESRRNEYYLDVPFIKYMDTVSQMLHFYYAAFVYVPKGDGNIWLKLTDSGKITEISSFSSCQPSALSLAGSDLMLYIDKLDFSGTSVAVDLKYFPTSDGYIWFVVTNTSTVTVEVDASQADGPTRDLVGANRNPSFSAQMPPGVNCDATSLYPAFGISQVRLHDSNVDLCMTYTAATKLNTGVSPAQPIAGCELKGSGGRPHFTWTPASSDDADLNNPNNYNFTSVDEAISGVIATGAQIYLRLGESYNGPNDTDDPVAWAKVATNIYKHVLGLFKPTAGIAVNPVYVEIFNEPDGGFWMGETATFNTLFVETAQRVRAAAAAAGKTVKVGGAGFTRNILTTSKQTGNPANGFVGAVGASTIDFVSAHLYNSCSAASLASSANFLRSLRAVVNGQGGSAKPLHITEWNIGLGSQCGNDFYADQRLQSFSSGILTLMQDPAQNIEAAHFYAAVPIMALFDFATTAGTARINPSAWAFWAHSKLREANSLRVQVCPQGSICVAGYAAESAPLLALAGQASSGQNIIVTNDGSALVTYKLRVKGLASSQITATVSNPPTGARDLTAKGNPIMADATELTALMATVAKDTQAALTVNGGQIELTLTIPAHTLQVVDVRTSLME